MNKIKYFILSSILFILGISSVNANTIKEIDINVYIDKNGEADITEVWDMYLDQGTEIYKPMNLDGRKLTNFNVKDESGTKYTNISWDVDKSLKQKKYKNGINYVGSGIELCWGMGSYGNHEYTINYKISDFITNYTDAQATLFKLVNDSMNPSPKKVKVEISSYYDFPDDLDVWGYGYKGYAYVSDGKIYMESESNISYSEYMVLLAKFPLNTFDTTRTENKTFNELHEGAEENTFSYDYGEEHSDSNIINIIVGLIFTILPLLSYFSFLVLVIYMVITGSPTIGNYDYGVKGKKISKEESGFYRDIPCDKDIFKAYFITRIYGLEKKSTDFLGTVLLKWLKEKQINIISYEKDKLVGSKTEYKIDFTKDYIGSNELEKKLYEMFRSASLDNYLEKKEFEKWCSKNYNKILGWFDKIVVDERKKFIELGLLEEVEQVKLKIFKKKVYKIDDRLRNEAVKLVGLKNFLKEFTLISEREAIEVTLYEEYLMYAQIFGIADKVAKQFKKLYPEVIEKYPEYDYNSFMIINSISVSGISRATSARSSAQSYSSGGGGFSSGGGGGGSFGGGSGGGCR